MNEWQLPLFPASGVAASVTFSVWIGVGVVVFFNLRFGWTLSGLVVPGYVVPLLMVKPTSAAVIAGESIVTYGLARWLSEGWGPRGWGWLPWWSSIFGRDRFFVIVLISILVRAAADGWLLPWIGEWLNHQLDVQFDYRNDLHSYGLIVVALVANYLWKPGLVRGLSTAACTTAISYALIRWVLLEYTNFSLGGLQYLYEDMSTSLLSSPKSYILVLTTAYIASRMNLRYSWDFNGILIPSLLALLWHEPTKILVSFAEATWVLILAGWVLRWSIWRSMTMEGGRKIFLFFTLATIHRLVLAHALPYLGMAQVTDSFGFGYLLTSLLAIKAYDKQVPLRIFRAVVEVSMLGAVLGSGLGFALSLLPLVTLPTPHEIQDVGLVSSELPVNGLWPMLSSLRVHWYAKRVPASYASVVARESTAFRYGLTVLRQSIELGQESLMVDARGWLRRANYQVTAVEERYLVLHEMAPQRGWGTYVIDRRATTDLLVEVPAPLDEWATFEAGYSIFRELSGRTLAVAGASRETNHDRQSDTLTQRNTMMAIFHEVWDQQDTLQVRGYTEEGLAVIDRIGVKQARAALDSVPTRLWVRKTLPRSTKFSGLRRLIDDLDVRWEDSPLPNVLRDASQEGFAEITLSSFDRRRMRNRIASREMAEIARVERIESSIGGVLRQIAEGIAPRGSEAYRAPLVEDLVYLDEEVLRPLLQLATQTQPNGPTWNQDEQATSIAAAAAAIGYRIQFVHDPISRSDYWVVSESLPQERHWGTFVLRHGLESPWIVEVPRPLLELNTQQFGIDFFERSGASAIALAGAHPHANRDGKADLTRLANKVNALMLTRQLLFRAYAKRPLVVVQCRAVQAPIDADIALATDDGTGRVAELSNETRALYDWLSHCGVSLRLVDGSELLAGYEVGIMLQSATLRLTENARLVNLWVAPSLRNRFRASGETDAEAEKFAALGIHSCERPLTELAAVDPLVSEESANTTSPAAPSQRDDDRPDPVPPQSPSSQPQGREVASHSVEPRQAFQRIGEGVQVYQQNGDVVPLFAARQQLPSCSFARWVDPRSGLTYLVVRKSDGTPWGVWRLDGSATAGCYRQTTINAKSVRTFERSGIAAWSLEALP